MGIIPTLLPESHIFDRFAKSVAWLKSEHQKA
jgi:hypothetical protein